MRKKTTLVTGANSDIGQYIVKALATKGLSIAAHYHKNVKPLERLKDELKRDAVFIKFFQYDLRKSDEAGELVKNVIKEFNRIDVLVNTIGPFYYKNILDVSPEEWNEAIQMNLNIAFNVTYFAREHICKRKGHVINFAFSGVENIKAWTMSTAYCAAKTGIAVLTKSLAAALAPYGVRVNAVCPGLIEVGSTTEKERLEMAKQIPFGRPGKPEEVAEIVRWLILESPVYLTGALIPIAGAWEF